MFTAFARAFKTPDLRKKLLFTLGIIVIYRLGAHVPAPGVDYAKVQQCIDQSDSGGLLGLMQMFSGGALLQITIFALGIMPYITASIILQLLTVVIPGWKPSRRRAVRHGEDHAVHALSDHRAGRPPGHRPRRHRPERGAVPELHRAGPDRRRQVDLHDPGDGHHHDRRYGRRHVAR